MLTISPSEVADVATRAQILTLPTIESELHQRFDSYRRQGEWFDPHPELIPFISSLQPSES